MRLPRSAIAPLLAGASLLLLLPACRSGPRANFEAVLSLAGEPGSPAPAESTVADELRARATLLSLSAKIEEGSQGDGLLTIRFRADDKDDALRKLDALCQTGTLSVRAVHDQSVFLADAARKDPSKLPPGHEIMTYVLQVDEISRVEDLVVQNAEIVDGSLVKGAEARRSKEHEVHISLTVKGGQKMMAATKNMQKGRSRLAIIFDGRIISAPVVVDVLASEFTLEGFNSFEEAQAIAASLNKPLSSNLLIESLKPLAR